MLVLLPIFGIKGFYACLFHAFELMPGMIVIVQHTEKAFLDVYLPCNEIFVIAQEGTDLLLDFLKGKQGVVGEDGFAVQLVVTGVAVHIFEEGIQANVSRQVFLLLHYRERIGNAFALR